MDGAEADYNQRVGERLRELRQRRGLSLKTVEAMSGGEIRSSILGAYERGARMVSVARLQRLAMFYEVTVDQLLPPVLGAQARGAARPPGREKSVPMTIGLAQLRTLDAPERNVLVHYVEAIQQERGDSVEVAIKLRDDDIVALGRIFGWDGRAMRKRLRELGVCL